MTSIRIDEMTGIIKEALRNYGVAAAVDEVGAILQVGDGIARVSGLTCCMAGEMLEFANGSIGLALNLEEGNVGCVILGPYRDLSEGAEVRRTGRVLEVPVGEALLGRVVDPLGRPLDGRGPIATSTSRKVESPAPGLADRRSVHEPLATGLKAIDSMTPVGRGQRELVIGDRKTGKTAICTDTIINQRGTGVICVYVAIGQKESTVAGIYQQLERAGAMGYTIIVSAPASSPAPMQFLAPYSGCAMAEHFMYSTWEMDEAGLPVRRDGHLVPKPLAEGGRGMHAFIAYDDLSKQAASYRELSLLLRRPPGREAYPGDVFYLHSRLLERAAKLRTGLGGGSLTAFPVIETQEGEVSAYIPTNVISITDGQIYLQPDLFNAGVRPAVDVGISVSRVGGAAQIKGMKQVAGTLRLELAAYRELQAFAQLGTDLDAATRRQLDRGARMVELLKQAQGRPMTAPDQVLVLVAAAAGLFAPVELDAVQSTQDAFLAFVHEHHPQLVEELRSQGALSPASSQGFGAVVQAFLERGKG